VSFEPPDLQRYGVGQSIRVLTLGREFVSLSQSGKRTTITRKQSRFRVQPPSHLTSQSPKREPIVTGVRRRRNFVSSGMLITAVHTFIARKRSTVKLGFPAAAAQDAASGLLL